MNHPLQRRQHERYSDSLGVKIVGLEQSCPELSKVFNSTRFVRTCGIFTQKGSTYAAKRYIHVTPCLRAGRNCPTPLPSYSPCLVWWGRVLVVTIRATRCGSSNNSWPTYSCKFHPIIMFLPVVWVVVVVVAGGGSCAAAAVLVLYVLTLYFLFSRQRS